MSPFILVVLILCTVFLTAQHLGYDPIWFSLMILTASFASYLIVLAPIHLHWWLVGKLFGG